jgi:exopolysaccharide biosynthesis polyprenyl glycosylphosphotransferase
MERVEAGLEGGWAARRVARPLVQGFGANLAPSERRWLLAAGDLLVANAALVVVVHLWMDLHVSFGTLLAYSKWFVTLSAVWAVLALALDAYDPVRAASTTHSLAGAVPAAVVTGLAYQLIPWLTPPPGRRMAFFGLIVLLAGGIAAWRAVYARFFFQPSFQRRAVVVGQDEVARRLAGELQAATGAPRANPFRGTGYEVVAFVAGLPVGQGPVLDPAHSFVRLVRAEGVEEVLVAEGAALTPSLHEALLDCRELGIGVTPLAAVYERLAARVPVAYAQRDLGLVVSGQESAGYRLYGVAKRLVDLGLSAVGLLGLGLVAPWVALGNALTSRGPLFYRQQRVGRGGRPFVVVKFRTMVPDAEGANGAVWARQGDPRVTPVGRVLRRLRLDELPQVWNVVRGEMSFVGPRPERPQFVGQLAGALPIYRVRHAVRPGITGWAQIRHGYGGTVEDGRIKLEYDLFYVKHAGLLLDLLILLRTIPVMLGLRGR